MLHGAYNVKLSRYLLLISKRCIKSRIYGTFNNIVCADDHEIEVVSSCIQSNICCNTNIHNILIFNDAKTTLSIMRCQFPCEEDKNDDMRDSLY